MKVVGKITYLVFDKFIFFRMSRCLWGNVKNTVQTEGP